QVAKRIEPTQLQPGDIRMAQTPPKIALLTPIPAVPPKTFTPPPQPLRRAAAPAALEAAPAVRTQAANPPVLLAGVPSQAPPKPQPRRFTQPPAAPAQGAPAIEANPNVTTAAIVGLNPLDRAVPVLPEATR